MRHFIEATPVLLQIILESNLETLLSLRLTCKSLYNLILAYEVSICQRVAERTFSNPIILLRPNRYPEPSLKWLLELQHRVTVVPRLSILAVSSGRAFNTGYSFLNVPAADPRCDELRLRVDNGWYILWHLSDIAIAVQASDRAAEPRRYLGLGPRQIELVRRQESEVLARRLEFLAQLDLRHVEDYAMMHRYMGVAFDWSYLCDLNEPESSGGNNPLFNGGRSWLNWYVLRVGPRLFVQAWRSEIDRKMMVQKINDEWRIRSRKRVNIERQFSHQFLDALRQKRWRPGREHVYDWVERFAIKYWEARTLGGEAECAEELMAQTRRVRLGLR